MGNYNNGIGRNGGAFGFKFASLNKVSLKHGTYLQLLT